MTDIITGERKARNTESLIRIAAKHSACMVVRDYEVARCVAERAREMGLDIPCPIPYSVFIGGQFAARGIKAFVIDDVDALARCLSSGAPVVAMSVTMASEGETWFICEADDEQ